MSVGLPMCAVSTRGHGDTVCSAARDRARMPSPRGGIGPHRLSTTGQKEYLEKGDPQPGIYPGGSIDIGDGVGAVRTTRDGLRLGRGGSASRSRSRSTE